MNARMAGVPNGNRLRECVVVGSGAIRPLLDPMGELQNVYFKPN